ncbi:MAG: hypothetical protein RLZZ352_957 [Pseudomonadota bacterium]|jgi:branched-chain amino acid transport system ATP-binding protein
MLMLDALHAHYGQTPVLHGVSLQVQAGEIVALLGRNGSGRSTTARAIMGLVACSGRLQWQGHDLNGLPTYARARLGLGYVPEGRDVFPQLTVQQNLLLGQQPGRWRGPVAAPVRWQLDDVYAMFPALQRRVHTAAGVLSGGEQQMLSIARTLMGNPALIIIDEPTEGLAPQVVAQLGQFLQTLKTRGVAVLLIEQKLTIALHISDRVLVMGQGRIVFQGTPAELRQDAVTRQEWLEV